MTAARDACQALLIDLDGVLRRFDPDHVANVERRHGLTPGSLVETAFAWPRLVPAITGQVSHEEWMAGVAEAVGAPDAVAEWFADRGTVADDVLALVREVRADGIPVAIASNATNWLHSDLDGLGLRDEVDTVVSSSVVGHHKPTREFFTAACAAVGTPPDRCLFIDDEHRNVAGARAAGLAALRYTGPADLPYVRAAVRASA